MSPLRFVLYSLDQQPISLLLLLVALYYPVLFSKSRKEFFVRGGRLEEDATATGAEAAAFGGLGGEVLLCGDVDEVGRDDDLVVEGGPAGLDEGEDGGRAVGVAQRGGLAVRHRHPALAW